MENIFTTTEISPDIPPASGGGTTRRPWHAPALKALKVSHTLANTHHGIIYDHTHYTTGS